MLGFHKQIKYPSIVTLYHNALVTVNSLYIVNYSVTNCVPKCNTMYLMGLYLQLVDVEIIFDFTLILK